MTSPVVDAERTLPSQSPANEGDERPSLNESAAAVADAVVTSSTHVSVNGHSVRVTEIQREPPAPITNGHASAPTGVEATPAVDAVTHRLGIHSDFCFFCRGFYGPSFGLPVCGPCHAFLFPDRAGEVECVEEAGAVGPEEKDDSGDSGNEEPTDFLGATGVDRTRKRGGGNLGGAEGNANHDDLDDHPRAAEYGFSALNDDGVDDDFEDALPPAANVQNDSRSRRLSTPSSLPAPLQTSHPPPPFPPLRSPQAEYSIAGADSDDHVGDVSSSSDSLFLYPLPPSSRAFSPSRASAGVSEEAGRSSRTTNDRLDAGPSGSGLMNGVNNGLTGGAGVMAAGSGAGAPAPIRSGRFSRLSGATNGAPSHNVKSEKLAEKILQMTTTKVGVRRGDRTHIHIHTHTYTHTHTHISACIRQRNCEKTVGDIFSMCMEKKLASWQLIMLPNCFRTKSWFPRDSLILFRQRFSSLSSASSTTFHCGRPCKCRPDGTIS